MSSNPRAARSIAEVFQAVHRTGVRYVVLRGWDGEVLSGSDVDLLVARADYAALAALLRHLGFARSGRGWMLMDLMARENYFDRQAGAEPVRIHLADRLLFGKPARTARLPVEAQVLAAAYIDPAAGCRRPDAPWMDLIAVCRAAIDRPDGTGAAIRAALDLPVGALEPRLQACRLQILNLLLSYHRAVIDASEMESRAVAILARLPGSQVAFRRRQSAVSRFLIRTGRHLVRLLGLFKIEAA
jgi:hypothetical protein